MDGIFSPDIAKNSKKSCPKSFCAYDDHMLCRPISLHEANALIPLIKERLERLHFYLMEMDPDEVSNDLQSAKANFEVIKGLDEEIVFTDDELERAEEKARVHVFIQEAQEEHLRHFRVRQMLPCLQMFSFSSLRYGSADLCACN